GELAGVTQDVAELVLVAGARGRAIDGRADGLEGQAVLALLPVHPGHPVVRLRVAGLGLQDALQQGRRSVEVALLEAHRAERDLEAAVGAGAPRGLQLLRGAVEVA